MGAIDKDLIVSRFLALIVPASNMNCSRMLLRFKAASPLGVEPRNLPIRSRVLHPFELWGFNDSLLYRILRPYITAE